MVRTNPITTVISLCLLIFVSGAVYAASDTASLGSSRIDRQFDRTKDHLVDRADWNLMSEADKQAYIEACLLELGFEKKSDDALFRRRYQMFREGLREVYE